MWYMFVKQFDTKWRLSSCWISQNFSISFTFDQTVPPPPLSLFLQLLHTEGAFCMAYASQWRMNQ